MSAAQARAPMAGAELALRLGITPDTLYRNLDRFVAETGMPLPLPALGTRPRRKWERSLIELWLVHRAPPRAANDAAAGEDGIAAERARLHEAYGGRRA